MLCILIVLAATGESLAELRGPVERDTALDFIENTLNAVDGQAVTITVSGLPSRKSEQAGRAEALLAAALPAFKAMTVAMGLHPFPGERPDVEIHDPPTEELAGQANAGADFEEVGPPAPTAGKRRGA